MSLMRIYFAHRRKRRIVLLAICMVTSIAAIGLVVWSERQDFWGWQFEYSGLTTSVELKRNGANEWVPVQRLQETQLQVNLDMQPSPVWGKLPELPIHFDEGEIRAWISFGSKVPLWFVEH